MARSDSVRNHAPWRKLILVPFWIVQMLFLVTMVGLLSLSLGVLAASLNSKKVTSTLTDAEKATVKRAISIILPIYFVICCYSLLATLAEMILLCMHKLKPVVFVVLSGSKAFIWTVLLVLNIASVAVVRGKGGGLILDILLTLSFLIPFIYGCTVCCRHRKSKAGNKNTQLPTDASYSQQYKTLPDEHHDLESTPLAGATNYNHPSDARYEPYRGAGHSVPSNPGMQPHDNLIAAHPNPNVPNFNAQHNGVDSYEMGNTKPVNAVMR